MELIPLGATKEPTSNSFLSIINLLDGGQIKKWKIIILDIIKVICHFFKCVLLSEGLQFNSGKNRLKSWDALLDFGRTRLFKIIIKLSAFGSLWVKYGSWV